MARTKNIRGVCAQCGAGFDFAAEHIGLEAACPHCGQTTELMLDTPPIEPTIPRRIVVWTTVTVGVLLVGLVLAFIALKRAERIARDKPAPVPAQTLPR
jgi:hypothetical protein